MHPLVVDRLPEYTELVVPVTSTSTIRVKSGEHPVLSRLLGEHVQVRIYEDRIEVRYADKLDLGCDRLWG